MTIIEGRVLAQAQRNFRVEFQRLFIGLLLEVRDLILQSADEDGEMNPVILPALESRLAGRINKFYMGANGKPFSDEGLPQSIYANLLFRAYMYIVYDVFMAHHKWFMKNTPKAYRDALARLPRRKALYPTEEQLEAAAREKYRVSEQSKPLPANDTMFRKNPYAEFNPLNMIVPLHQNSLLWDGELKRVNVSRHIWGANQHSQRRVLDVLRQGINSGLNVTEIAESLESHLSPYERSLFLRNPYINWEAYDPNVRRGAFGIPFPRIEQKRGQSLATDRGPDVVPGQRNYYNYSAMRLAQTELSRAFNRAKYTAGLNNPAVIGIEWRLSPSHPVTDICDSIATLGKGGERLRPLMPKNSATIPPAHPWCLCYVEDALQSEEEFMHQLIRDAEELGEMYEQLQNMRQTRQVPYEGIDVVGNLIDTILGQVISSTLPQDLPRTTVSRFFQPAQTNFFEDGDLPF